MNLKKALHHEAYGDHEELSWSGMILDAYPQGGAYFWSNTLLFFAAFVSFVVQTREVG